MHCQVTKCHWGLVSRSALRNLTALNSQQNRKSKEKLSVKWLKTASGQSVLPAPGSSSRSFGSIFITAILPLVLGNPASFIQTILNFHHHRSPFCMQDTTLQRSKNRATKTKGSKGRSSSCVNVVINLGVGTQRALTSLASLCVSFLPSLCCDAVVQHRQGASHCSRF